MRFVFTSIESASIKQPLYVVPGIYELGSLNARNFCLYPGSKRKQDYQLEC